MPRAIELDRCRIPPAFWRAMQGAGIEPPALLRQARLPATLHLDPQAAVRTSDYFALLRAVETLLREPGLGLRLVAALDTSAHPPSSLVAFHARDYRDGVQRLARFKRLCTPELLQLDEERRGLSVTVRWRAAGTPAPALATDVTMATLIELGRRSAGVHVVPLSVELVAQARDAGPYEAYFGCPVHFGRAEDRLLLRREDLDRPFPGRNPELLDMLLPPLAAALAELQAQDAISAQVTLALKRVLASGRPDLAQVAADLGMSERTLQRRITDEGTSFRSLLLEARRSLGRQLLESPDCDIQEVAFLLGYQDTNAFHRAFKEWEGVTPARWRAMQGGAAADVRS